MFDVLFESTHREGILPVRDMDDLTIRNLLFVGVPIFAIVLVELW